jgi:hypothetical protein
MPKIGFPNKTAVQIQLFLTLISVAMAIILFVISARLAPLAQSITDLSTDVKADEAANTAAHSNFITKDTFAQLNTDVTHISNRVDSIYNIVAIMKK